MQYSSSNKRIAINTVYMYLRLFITLVIGLYTSRIVLLVLGISDYGLYNVVGGIITMFTFISGSLNVATSRFFNVEMGDPNGDVNRSYNVNLLLHSAFAVIVLLFAETIGLWYIYNRLNVPDGRLNDAVFVFQISILSACIGIINGPCASLFTAFEKFAFLAKIDIINTLIRFLGVFLLQYYQGNSLKLYSILMCLTTVNTFVVYYWIALKRWPKIIKRKFINEWKYYKGVLSFGAWNVLSTMALMLRSTGSDLLINHFFNTAVNGAFALSKTVNNHVITFSANFDSASGPQIIQSYSSENYERCGYLVNKMGRFCLLFFLLLFFPLYIELDYVLHLWLKVVPDNVLIFCRINLLLAGVSLTCGGLLQLIHASGRIKWFKINGIFFFIICIPLGYWSFSEGEPAYSILLLFLCADILMRIVQLVLIKKIIGFDSWKYVKDAYSRPMLIAVIMSIILWLYSYITINSGLLKMGAIFLCFIITASLVYIIGLTSAEKSKVGGRLRETLGVVSRLMRKKLN